jgi:hypothetical protein
LAGCVGLGYSFNQDKDLRILCRAWTRFTKVNTGNNNQGISFVFQIPIAGAKTDTNMHNVK